MSDIREESGNSTTAQASQPIFKETQGVGVVKAVPSGDTVILLLTDQPYPPPEREITLSSLRAPKLARLNPANPTNNTEDEKFAWDSREFLRSKVIGRTVQYYIENKNPTTGREYGLLKVNNENIVDSIISAGWARVHSPTGREGGRNLKLERMLETEKEAKGVFTKDPVALQNAVRKIATKFDRDQRLDLYERIKNKSIDAFIDQVRNGSSYRVWITEEHNNQKLWYYLLVRVAGVQSPGLKFDPERPDAPPTEEPFYHDARFFAERRLLHRWVKITFTTRGIDKNIDTFIGKIRLGEHSIGEALLKEGLAEFIDVNVTPEDEKNYRALERVAKEQKLRIWKNFHFKNNPVASQLSSSSTEYVGKVRAILSCTTIVIEDPRKNKELKNISLSSVTPPSLDEKDDIARIPNAKERESSGKYLRWEGREVLRNKLIGKKVRVIQDYARDMPSEQGRGVVTRSYCTVLLDKENIAVSLVEQGLAGVANHRPNDKRSSSYDLLIKAEKTAKKQLQGKFAKVIPPYKITDLTSLRDSDPPFDNPQKEMDVLVKKAKNFKPFLTRAGRVAGIVEFVQSPTRFKIYIPKENCMISFVLSGISAPGRPDDRNDPLFQQSLEFTRVKLNQRNVEVIVDDQDKSINFIGSLFIEKKDYAVILLENGLALLRSTADKLPNYSLMKKAEDDAKNQLLNVWHDYMFEDEVIVNTDDKKSERKIEYIRAEVTEIVDGSLFFIHIKGDEFNSLSTMMQKIQEVERKPVNFAPRVGQQCLARFSQDNNYYRAVVRKINSGECTVFYVDYGNSETLSTKQLYPIEPEFTNLPPQAKPAQLAYLRVPSLKEEFGIDAKNYLGLLVWNKLLYGSIEFKEKDRLFLTLGDPESQVLVNAALVKVGLARVDKRANSAIPMVAKLRDEEEYAKRSHQYIWHYGDISDDEDDMPAKKGKTRKGKK